MKALAQQQNQPNATRDARPARPRLLQRTCACGAAPGFSGQCESCAARRLSAPRAAGQTFMDTGRGDGFGLSRFQTTDEPSAGGSELKGDDPQDGECAGVLKAFYAHLKGEVQVYETSKEQILQLGRTRGEESEQSRGVIYAAGVALDPEDCAELEFVQNVQATRIIVFKDDSQLVMNTAQLLDGEDPYPTYALKKGETNIKKVMMNDSPSQGTGDVVGLISSISVSESFKLFLRFRGGGEEKIIGVANWGWVGEAATTDAADNSALLRKVSGQVYAPDGVTVEDGGEKPVTSPRAQDQKFLVVGGKDSYAVRFESLFNKTKKHQEDAASPDEAREETKSAPCVPKLNFLKAEKTGSINIREGRDGCELSFGGSGSPGMSLRSEVETPCAGRLEYLQLIDARRQRRDAQDRDDCLKSDGFVLDTRDPQAGRWVTLPGTKTFESNDSPGASLTGFVHHSAQDSFRTWLLWRADKPDDSPRVPLGMVEWRWKAQADKIGDTDFCAVDWMVSDAEAVGGVGSLPEGAETPAPAKNVADLLFNNGPC